MNKKNEQAVVPPAALWLGYAGVIPFAATALIVAVAWPSDTARAVLDAQLAYGAVILSFLGGARWGLAAARLEGSALAGQLTVSVAPALIGWLALFLAPVVGLGVLMIAFAALYASDRSVTARGDAPAWYGALRLPLTILVVATLAISFARLLTSPA